MRFHVIICAVFAYISSYAVLTYILLTYLKVIQLTESGFRIMESSFRFSKKVHSSCELNLKLVYCEFGLDSIIEW